MGNDRFIVTQSEIQIVTQRYQDQQQHAKPERYAPVAPLKGVVLNILRREEFIQLGGVHLHLYHLKGQVCSLQLLAVYLHLEGWQMIEITVKRGKGNDKGVVSSPLRMQHLYTWHQQLSGLKLRPFYLGTFLSLNSQRYRSLLTNQHLYRVYLGINTRLSNTQQCLRHQYDYR